MIGPEHERLRPDGDEGFGDAVTFAFGDAEAELYGTARVGIAPATGTLSALAVLFSGREPVAVRAQGGIDADAPDWSDVEAAGVRARVHEPLARWSVAFAGDGAGFELDFSALSPPLEFGAGSATARAGGMEGYEQLCRVEGEVAVGENRRTVRCLGQRGHSWGAPNWDSIARAATLSAWLGEDRAIALQTVLPAGTEGHEAEAVSAFLLEGGEHGSAAHAIAEPRLSATYDAEGHQLRAGLELWVTDEDDAFPRRAAGEAVCGTTLELGRLRLDSAFFAWHMEDRAGVGRYEVLRRMDS